MTGLKVGWELTRCLFERLVGKQVDRLRENMRVFNRQIGIVLLLLLLLQTRDGYNSYLYRIRSGPLHSTRPHLNIRCNQSINQPKRETYILPVYTDNKSQNTYNKCSAQSLCLRHACPWPSPEAPVGPDAHMTGWEHGDPGGRCCSQPKPRQRSWSSSPRPGRPGGSSQSSRRP